MYTETKYGFKWGGLEIERTASTPEFGWLVTIKGAKGAIEVRVTPGGYVKVDRKRPLHKNEKEALNVR